MKSLKKQNSKYELILLDNPQGKFKSAAEALNHGGRRAKGKYIMFVHQDVMLGSDSWLEEVEKVLDELPNLGIAGVAGKKDEKGVMTVIKHDNPPKLAGEIYLQKPTKVQTLDECLVIIPQSVFDTLRFDEEVCDNWHLYAVDYCLSAIKLGFDVYVLPMFIYHKSPYISKSLFQTILSMGSLPKGYYQTLDKVLEKHKNYVRQVYTTCGNWMTSHPVILQRIGLLAKGGLKLLLRKGWQR
jgi:hypothetical protein